MVRGRNLASVSDLFVALPAKTDRGELQILAIPLVVFASATGLIVANSIAVALNDFPECAGAVSALVSALLYGQSRTSLQTRRRIRVYAFVRELMRNHSVIDATYARTMAVLHPTALVELVSIYVMGAECLTNLSLVAVIAGRPSPGLTSSPTAATT